MVEEEIEELSTMITKKVVLRIVMKLDEIEAREEKKIKLWNYDDENVLIYGIFEDGEEFSEKI